MLFVNKWIGGTGNQILQYNNLVQISSIFNTNYSSTLFDNCEMFRLKNFNGVSKIDEVLTSEKLLNDNFTIEENKNYLIDVCLHELFFKFNKISTFDIFKFKDTLPLNNKKQITIHFRGGDYKIWDPKSQLKVDYYIDSIKFIKNEINDEYIFNIITDDYTLDSYNLTKKYLEDSNEKIMLGNPNNPKNDFITISNSEYIISSPSTFCITASFCGKKDKKIIHSHDWIEYKLNSDYFRDIFWKKLNYCGNEDYKIWKKI